jgi:CRISPR-associated endoribonuclease Cas6
MPPRSRPTPKSAAWAEDVALVAITLQVQPLQDSTLYPQYTIGLHAWLLDQVRQHDPQLSAMLHDNQDEKPFTISGLIDPHDPLARSLRLVAAQTYDWQITALNRPVAQWLRQWLENLPGEIDLRTAPLKVLGWSIAARPDTYEALFDGAAQDLEQSSESLSLTFLSPTSFRRKGNHFPLPVPTNLFHSYLRRWNQFGHIEYDADEFLEWIDESVLIMRHHLESVKVVAGKQGSVTGFRGAITLGLTAKGREDAEYTQLFTALGYFAPYCGTGHKTTFGLGQTWLGWRDAPTASGLASATAVAPTQDLLAQRIAELTEQFLATKKQAGSQRALASAESWATILARRERGESVQAIAADLEMNYQTVKTYLKLARRQLANR